jgi:hypothetical protein
MAGKRQARDWPQVTSKFQNGMVPQRRCRKALFEVRFRFRRVARPLLSGVCDLGKRLGTHSPDLSLREIADTVPSCGTPYLRHPQPLWNSIGLETPALYFRRESEILVMNA